MYKKQYEQLKQLLLVGGDVTLVVKCRDKRQDGIYPCTVLKNIKNESQLSCDLPPLPESLVGTIQRRENILKQISKLNSELKNNDNHEATIRASIGELKALLLDKRVPELYANNIIAAWNKQGFTNEFYLNTISKPSCPMSVYWQYLINKADEKQDREKIQAFGEILNKTFEYANNLLKELSEYHFGFITSKGAKGSENVVSKFDVFNNPHKNKDLWENNYTINVREIDSVIENVKDLPKLTINISDDVKTYFETYFDNAPTDEQRKYVYTKLKKSNLVGHFKDTINSEVENYKKRIETGTRTMKEDHINFKTAIEYFKGVLNGVETINTMNQAIKILDTEYKKNQQKLAFARTEFDKGEAGLVMSKAYMKSLTNNAAAIKKYKEGITSKGYPNILFARVDKFHSSFSGYIVFGSWAYIENEQIFKQIKPGEHNNYARRQLDKLEPGDPVLVYEENIFRKKDYTHASNIKTIFAFKKIFEITAKKFSNLMYKTIISPYNIACMLSKTKCGVPEHEVENSNFFGKWVVSIEKETLQCINLEPGKMSEKKPMPIAEQERVLEKGDTIYVVDNTSNFVKIKPKIFNTEVELEKIIAFEKSYRRDSSKDKMAYKNLKNKYEVKQMHLQKIVAKCKKFNFDKIIRNIRNMIEAYYNSVRTYEYDKNFPGHQMLEILFYNNEKLRKFDKAIPDEKKNPSLLCSINDDRKNCNFACAWRKVLRSNPEDPVTAVKEFMESFHLESPEAMDCYTTLKKSGIKYKQKTAENQPKPNRCGNSKPCNDGYYCFRMMCKKQEGLQGQEFLESLGSKGENIPKVLGWIKTDAVPDTPPETNSTAATQTKK